MRTITLFDYGDKVSPTPVWVALHALENIEPDIAEKILQAKEGVGVVTDANITQGKVVYSIEWRSPMRPDYNAWFSEDEVRPAEEQEDFAYIPFDEYRNDWRSVNKPGAVNFRNDMINALKKEINKTIIKAIKKS